MQHITNPKIESYINHLVPKRNEVLMRLEAEGVNEGIPNIQLISIDFITTLLTAYQSKMMLEIGTAIGYSGISMLGARTDSFLVTIERDRERYDRAVNNFREASLYDRAELLFGDALELLPTLNQTFDFVFIDAAKGQYIHFLDLIIPKVKIGGLIVTDNTLFRGYVADESEIPSKYEKMIHKLRYYNEYLSNHEQLKTSHLPLGDGIAISVRTK